ncbi:MAG: ApaG domain [Verrucomicrobia bacterium]|nr:MAG: ApaG domain [Verrucomicrobiota bacterium]
MSQGCVLVELDGLRVTVDKLVYRHLSASEKPHSFVYFITIHNDSDVSVTIRGRKWVVSHDDGTTLVVEGDGVVGQTPTIAPGGRFSYNSQHLVGSGCAVAEGAYLGMDEHGRRVVTRIPRFKMTVPNA